MQLANSKPFLIQFILAIICLISKSLEKKYLLISKSKFKGNHFCNTIYEEVISLENNNITRTDDFCNGYYEFLIYCNKFVAIEIAILSITVVFSLVYMILDKCSE